MKSENKNNLTFFDITQLSERDQYHIIFNEGKFVDYSDSGVKSFVLYKLYNFYVEVIYDSLTNRIQAISSFLSVVDYRS